MKIIREYEYDMCMVVFLLLLLLLLLATAATSIATCMYVACEKRVLFSCMYWDGWKYSRRHTALKCVDMNCRCDVCLRFFSLSHSFSLSTTTTSSSSFWILYRVYSVVDVDRRRCRRRRSCFVRINAMWCCSTSFVVVVVDFSPALCVMCVYVWSWVERKFSQNRISSLLTFENINRIAVQQDNKRRHLCEHLM